METPDVQLQLQRICPTLFNFPVLFVLPKLSWISPCFPGAKILLETQLGLDADWHFILPFMIQGDMDHVILTSSWKLDRIDFHLNNGRNQTKESLDSWKRALSLNRFVLLRNWSE